MRLAIFSDLHLDATFRSLGEAGDSRRVNLRKTLQNIIERAHEQSVDALLCGGDLYENEGSGPDTRSFLVGAFRDCEMPVLLAPGNHDWYGPRSLYAQADWSENVHIFTTDKFEPYDRLDDGFTIWGAAHDAPTGTPGFFHGGFRAPDVDSVHIGLFHGAEEGAIPFEVDRDGNPKSGHAPFTEQEIEASGMAHALVGHYHSPKDRDLYTYPGSPDPLSFGEINQPGLVIADFGPKGLVDRSRMEVWVTKVHDLPLDITGAENSTDVLEQHAELINGLTGYARVTIQGRLNPDAELPVSQLQAERGQLEAQYLRIGLLIPAYDFDALIEEPSVRGGFVRSVMASDLEEGERNDVLTAGLKALDDLPISF
ncbi:MAG: exonuclease SbcCD subunit D [Acidimicrobiia bacterium]